jgi:hypothetical protein
MAEKEKGFSMENRNVFREVAVYLTLVYEKTLENKFKEALADLQHCYDLLGTNRLQYLTTSETRVEEIDLMSVRGKYFFNEETQEKRFL